MGTHNTAIAFMALELGVPTSVSGQWASVIGEQFPAWSMLDMVLPASRNAGTIVMHWYDGGKLPPASLVDDIRLDGNGCVFVGTEGRAYLPGSMNQYLYLLPRNRFRAVVLPELHPTLDVYEEWLLACIDHRPTTCNFAGYSATITEAMLVANLAIQLGRSIQWDADLAQVRGAPDAQPFIDNRSSESGAADAS